MFTVVRTEKIVNNVEILAQSSADFAINSFQGTHISGASHGNLCDSSVFLYYRPTSVIRYWLLYQSCDLCLCV